MEVETNKKSVQQLNNIFDKGRMLEEVLNIQLTINNIYNWSEKNKVTFEKTVRTVRSDFNQCLNETIFDEDKVISDIDLEDILDYGKSIIRLMVAELNIFCCNVLDYYTYLEQKQRLSNILVEIYSKSGPISRIKMIPTELTVKHLKYIPDRSQFNEIAKDLENYIRSKHGNVIINNTSPNTTIKNI